MSRMKWLLIWWNACLYVLLKAMLIYSYLCEIIETRLIRDDSHLPMLQDIKKRYPVIVDFGSGAGHIIKHLDRDITQKLIMCDSAGTQLSLSRSDSDTG